MAGTFAFDPAQRHNFDQWMASDDVTPQGLYQSLGISPGFGKYRTREELAPSFLDKFLDRFGIQTDRVKELKELAIKQDQLKPFAQDVLRAKIADQVHLNAIKRATPATDQEVSPAVAKMLMIDQPGQTQPFPVQQVNNGGANSLVDPNALIAQFPEGAPGQVAAQEEQDFAQKFLPPPGFTKTNLAGPMSVDTFGGRRPMPSLRNNPEGMDSMGVMRGPEPFPLTNDFALDENGQPVSMAMVRPMPLEAGQPPQRSTMMQAETMPAVPRPAPRNLSIPERLQVADAMKAQATGHLVPDETGKLVPASFALPDARSLDSEQQAALIDLMNGGQGRPGVRLPPASFMAALKGKQEAKVGSMPEIVKLQNQADQLPEGSPRRAQLEDRIRRLTTESKADIGAIAAAQAEFAALPANQQTSQNAARIAARHKDVPTEEIMKGAKNPNQPLVNINTGVTASEEAQKEFMKSSRATFDQLKAAPAAIRNIETAKTLIDKARGFMGPGGESLLSAAKFLNNRLGTKIDTEGVKTAEELRSRIFFNIMDNLKKLDAQPSQLQQQIMMDSLGKLGTDPNALSNVLDAFADSIQEKVAQHNAEVSSAEQRGVKFPFNPHIKLPQRTKGSTSTAATNQPATVANDADYDKLPSGALFVGPDGKTRRKP